MKTLKTKPTKLNQLTNQQLLAQANELCSELYRRFYVPKIRPEKRPGVPQNYLFEHDAISILVSPAHGGVVIVQANDLSDVGGDAAEYRIEQATLCATAASELNTWRDNDDEFRKE